MEFNKYLFVTRTTESSLISSTEKYGGSTFTNITKGSHIRLYIFTLQFPLLIFQEFTSGHGFTYHTIDLTKKNNTHKSVWNKVKFFFIKDRWRVKEETKRDSWGFDKKRRKRTGCWAVLRKEEELKERRKEERRGGQMGSTERPTQETTKRSLLFWVIQL